MKFHVVIWAFRQAFACRTATPVHSGTSGYQIQRQFTLPAQYANIFCHLCVRCGRCAEWGSNAWSHHVIQPVTASVTTGSVCTPCPQICATSNISFPASFACTFSRTPDNARLHTTQGAQSASCCSAVLQRLICLLFGSSDQPVTLVIRLK